MSVLETIFEGKEGNLFIIVCNGITKGENDKVREYKVEGKSHGMEGREGVKRISVCCCCCCILKEKKFGGRWLSMQMPLKRVEKDGWCGVIVIVMVIVAARKPLL